MISGEWQKVMQKVVRWPSGVCGASITIQMKCMEYEVGECFFWYRLTQNVPDKIQRALKQLCVCMCVRACVTVADNGSCVVVGI